MHSERRPMSDAKPTKLNCSRNFTIFLLCVWFLIQNYSRIIYYQFMCVCVVLCFSLCNILLMCFFYTIPYVAIFSSSGVYGIFLIFETPTVCIFFWFTMKFARTHICLMPYFRSFILEIYIRVKLACSIGCFSSPVCLPACLDRLASIWLRRKEIRL